MPDDDAPRINQIPGGNSACSMLGLQAAPLALSDLETTALKISLVWTIELGRRAHPEIRVGAPHGTPAYKQKLARVGRLANHLFHKICS